MLKIYIQKPLHKLFNYVLHPIELLLFLASEIGGWLRNPLIEPAARQRVHRGENEHRSILKKIFLRELGHLLREQLSGVRTERESHWEQLPSEY